MPSGLDVITLVPSMAILSMFSVYREETASFWNYNPMFKEMTNNMVKHINSIRGESLYWWGAVLNTLEGTIKDMAYDLVSIYSKINGYDIANYLQTMFPVFLSVALLMTAMGMKSKQLRERSNKDDVNVKPRRPITRSMSRAAALEQSTSA